MKKKRRFGRRVFCVLIVLFMGVIWQSDLLSQEPAEVRSLRKQEILQTDDNYREYYFGLLTEDEKKINSLHPAICKFHGTVKRYLL